MPTVEDISRRKAALRTRQDDLRRLLNDWDPIGVYGQGSQAPLDEYDCLHGVIGMLREGSSEAALAKFLVRELKDHFGVDPAPARPGDFAARLYRWYWSDPLPGSVDTA